jgi:tetratricopeptide (TPR) repeat protein
VNRKSFGEFLNQVGYEGDLDRLVGCLRRMVERYDRRSADAYPEYGFAQECLARALDDNGDWCGAALALQGALKSYRSNGEDVSTNIARCLCHLGRYYFWTGRPVEAERTLAEALTNIEHLPIVEQGGRGFVLVDQSQLHSSDGNYEIAEGLLHQATKEMLHYCGYGDSHIAFVFLHLSLCMPSKSD